jgi:hypothetical protein
MGAASAASKPSAAQGYYTIARRNGRQQGRCKFICLPPSQQLALRAAGRPFCHGLDNRGAGLTTASKRSIMKAYESS